MALPASPLGLVGKRARKTVPARKLQGLTGLQARAVPFSEGLAATSAPALPPQHSLDHLLTPCQAEQAPLGAHRPSCPRQSGRRPLCCLGRWAGQPPPAHRAPPALPYLGSNILKRGWAHQGEADQEDVLERRGPRRRRSRRLQKAPVPLTSGLRGPPQPPSSGGWPCRHLQFAGRRVAAAGRSPPAQQCPTAPG